MPLLLLLLLAGHALFILFRFSHFSLTMAVIPSLLDCSLLLISDEVISLFSHILVRWFSGATGKKKHIFPLFYSSSFFTTQCLADLYYCFNQYELITISLCCVLVELLSSFTIFSSFKVFNSLIRFLAYTFSPLPHRCTVKFNSSDMNLQLKVILLIFSSFNLTSIALGSSLDNNLCV